MDYAYFVLFCVASLTMFAYLKTGFTPKQLWQIVQKTQKPELRESFRDLLD